MLLRKPRVSVAEVAVLCYVMTNYANGLHDKFSNFNINVLLR